MLWWLNLCQIVIVRVTGKVISHNSCFYCQPRRENLSLSLSKHIPVDVYGACGTLKCERSNESNFLVSLAANWLISSLRSQDDYCKQMLNSSYKFYLALENSVCQDYVTEKFFKVLQYNVIPGALF